MKQSTLLSGRQTAVDLGYETRAATQPRRGTAFKALAVACVLFAGAAASAHAQSQASVSGQVSAYSGVFFEAAVAPASGSAGDYFQPSVSLKLSPSYSSGPLTIKSDFTTSVSLAETGYTANIQLGEAYASFDAADGLNITAGSKVISWGTALIANPEGYINPVDSLSQLVAENRSDWLLPVPLVSGKLIRGPFSFEAVALPWFRPSTLPSKGSRWYPAALAALDAKDGYSVPASLPSYPGVKFSVDTVPADVPLNVANMQGAGRAGFSLGAVDFGLSGWYGFTKNPVIDVTTTLGVPVKVDISASYKRQGAVGMDMSATVLDSSVVWLESAIFLPEYYVGAESSGLPVSIDKNTLKSAFGVDRTIGIGNAGDIYLAVEGNLAWIADYDARLSSSVKETGLGGTLVTEFRTPAQDFTLRAVVMEPDFFTLDSTGQYLIRLSINYKPVDSCTLSAGTTLFEGTSGAIGQYAHNNFAYVSVTTSF